MQSTLKEWHNLKWLSGLNRQQPFPSPEWKPSYFHQLQPPPNSGISCDGNMLCKGYENHLFEQRVYLLKVRKYAPKRKPDRFQPSLFRGWQPTIHFSQQKDLRISGAWGKPPHFFRHTHYVGTSQPSEANLIFLCSRGPSRRFGKVDLKMHSIHRESGAISYHLGTSGWGLKVHTSIYIDKRPNI